VYNPLNTKSGAAAVSDWFNQFTPRLIPSPVPTPDGKNDLLQLAPTGAGRPLGAVTIAETLLTWLLNLRLLRGVPLCYLVPDARLLPPESIRFFHVDQTWIDRLIDGVYAAANVGTVDSTYSYAFLGAVRNTLDGRLQDLAKSLGGQSWTPGSDPLTGCLIRSELIRRWPDLVVTAFHDAAPPAAAGKPPAAPTNPLAVLRAETLSTDILIALFAGQPKQVQIREPHVAMRFGVDMSEADQKKPDLTGVTMSVDLRNTDGTQVPPAGPNQAPPTVTVTAGKAANRTLNIKGFYDSFMKKYSADNLGAGPRTIALQFERPAYVQDFILSPNVAENGGSVSPLELIKLGPAVPLRNGRALNLDKFVARLGVAERNGRV
jgi:hypothetical protein